MKTTLDDLRGEIFLLHIVDNLSFKDLKEEMERRHGISFKEKQYKDKTQEWGYWKNLRGPVVCDILRAKNQREAQGERSEFFLNQRMVDMDDVENHYKRRKVDKKNNNSPRSKNKGVRKKVGQIVVRQPPPPSPPPQFAALGPPTAYLSREKLLYKIEMLVRKSFERGDWRFFNNERLINVPKAGLHESRNIMLWESNMDLGIAAAKMSDELTAGQRLNAAKHVVDSLIVGRHHNIILNILRKLSDLQEAGYSSEARKIMQHITQTSEKYRGSSTHPLPDIFRLLDAIDVRGLAGLDDRVSEIFCTLFLLYLGYRCYNTFVMDNDRARTRLLRDDNEDIDSNLPNLHTLDKVYGPTNMRALDVLRLRLEILHHRQQYDRIVFESEKLRHRANVKLEDPWQRHYFLIKALYYGGNAYFALGKWQTTKHWYAAALDWIESFGHFDTSDQFRAQKWDMERTLEVISWVPVSAC